MKSFHRIIAGAAVLLLCLALTLPVFGSDAASETASDWDAIVAELMQRFGGDENSIHLGYLNLVTGEEHYVSPDEYMLAASMYKLPLCMYYTEILASGEFDWSPYEQYFSFEFARDKVLIESDNDTAEWLYDRLGGYDAFRDLTAHYIGVEPMTEPREITMWNNYTAREFITCLKLLYTERERFPGIIEAMQKAMPDQFFKRDEPRFRIAHKPGWLTEPVMRNDCGICFTQQPIAIVAFTRGLTDPEGFLTAYCTAMCEYTEALASIPSPTPEPTPEPAPLATPDPIPTAEPAPAPAVVSDRMELSPLIAAGAVVLFAVVALVLVIVLCVKYRARFFGLFLAVLLSAAGMLLAVAGAQVGTIYARPSGDPAQTVTRFFDALCAGNYDAAYAELGDYADLGLAARPGTPAGQRVYDALHQSYACTLAGPCRMDRLEAVQPVRFRHLDLPSLEEAVSEETQRQAELIVQQRPASQIYDENKRYRPEVANEAYLAALDRVLQNADAYCTEESFDLSLRYADGRWQLLTSPALLRALAGGTAY